MDSIPRRPLYLLQFMRGRDVTKDPVMCSCNPKTWNAEIGRVGRLMRRERFGIFASRKHFSCIIVFVIRSEDLDIVANKKIASMRKRYRNSFIKNCIGVKSPGIFTTYPFLHHELPAYDFICPPSSIH